MIHALVSKVNGQPRLLALSEDRATIEKALGVLRQVEANRARLLGQPVPLPSGYELASAQSAEELRERYLPPLEPSQGIPDTHTNIGWP